MKKENLPILLILASTSLLMVSLVVRATASQTDENSCSTEVAVYSAAFSPESNITTYLINAAYWAPQVGKPWLKLNDPATNELVSMTAKVHRTDAVPGSVLAYVTWTGTTAAGHTEEFGYAIQLMDPGDDLNFGPVNIADTAPAVGKYEVWLNAYVLADNAVNTNVGGTANFHSGYFYMKGYCDINGDNVVDLRDYILVKRATQSLPGGAKWNYMADVNNSNSCTAADYQLVKMTLPEAYQPN